MLPAASRYCRIWQACHVGLDKLAELPHHLVYAVVCMAGGRVGAHGNPDHRYVVNSPILLAFVESTAKVGDTNENGKCQVTAAHQEHLGSLTVAV